MMVKNFVLTLCIWMGMSTCIVGQQTKNQHFFDLLCAGGMESGIYSRTFDVGDLIPGSKHEVFVGIRNMSDVDLFLGEIETTFPFDEYSPIECSGKDVLARGLTVVNFSFTVSSKRPVSNYESSVQFKNPNGSRLTFGLRGNVIRAAGFEFGAKVAVSYPADSDRSKVFIPIWLSNDVKPSEVQIDADQVFRGISWSIDTVKQETMLVGTFNPSHLSVNATTGKVCIKTRDMSTVNACELNMFRKDFATMSPSMLVFVPNDKEGAKLEAHCILSLCSNRTPKAVLESVECEIANRIPVQVKVIEISNGFYRAIFSYDPSRVGPIQGQDLKASIDWFTSDGPVGMKCAIAYGRR